jgi:hypothetical protein
VLPSLVALMLTAFIDGRQFAPHVDSTAKWQGDTLVVDSRGFNGKVWLDQLGKPSDDPGALTRPWIVAVELVLLPDTQLMEFICL